MSNQCLLVEVMETQGPGCSLTQELDWRDYDYEEDLASQKVLMMLASLLMKLLLVS